MCGAATIIEELPGGIAKLNINAIAETKSVAARQSGSGCVLVSGERLYSLYSSGLLVPLYWNQRSLLVIAGRTSESRLCEE